MPRWLPSQFFLGLDLGREQDHTALIVLERTNLQLDVRDASTFEFLTDSKLIIRHIRRFPLKMSYPAIADHIRELANKPQLAQRSRIALDNTGVGIAFHDFLRTPKPPAPITTITITAGREPTRTATGWNVPKPLLFSTLYTAFKDKHVRIGRKLRDGRALLTELASMRLSITATGHESFAPRKSSQHDDLVLATSLAVYLALNVNKARTSHGPLPGLPTFNGF